MLAKLVKSYKYPRAVLFSGREFVKSEWREVPVEFENAAKEDDRLETKAGTKKAAASAETPISFDEGEG